MKCLHLRVAHTWCHHLVPPPGATTCQVVHLVGAAVPHHGYTSLQLTPSTPSVANTGKRAFLIWTSVLLFGNEVTFLSGLGTAVVILGVLLYNVALGVDARALGLPRIVQVGSDKMFTQRV